MFAEKIFDGSFEGVPEYRFVFRKETDRLEQPWYPDGAVHRGEFALDTVDPFNGKQSQRITMEPGDPCTLGVSQAGVYVERDSRSSCRCFSRGQTSPHPCASRSGAKARRMPKRNFSRASSGSVFRPR